MGFYNPGSFVWLILAAAIAVLYLMIFAKREQEVATFTFWQRAIERRPAWFRLRFWLSLATQIAILLLMVVALTHPFWTRVAASRRNMVLILDVSASMSATDVQPSRFEQMRESAKQLVGSLQKGEQLAILAAGTTVQPLASMGAGSESLLAACDALAPTDGATRIPEAVDAARRLLQDESNPHIVVLTDGGFYEAAELAVAEHVHLLIFGDSTPRNAAVTQLQHRPLPTKPGHYAVSVDVTNGGASTMSVPLTVGIHDGEMQTFDLEVAASETTRRELTVQCREDALLEASLDIDDDLASDNFATRRVSGRPPTRVRLVAAESGVGTACRDALEAVEGIELEVVSSMPTAFEHDHVHVFYREIPAELPPGNILILAPQTACDLWTVDQQITGQDCQVSKPQTSRTLLADVGLVATVFERAVVLKFQQNATSLAVTESGAPIYSLVERPNGSVLAFHADLEREHSDFTLRPGFARLVQNAVRYLLTPAKRDAPAVTPREAIRLAAGTTASLQTNAAETVAIEAKNSTLSVFDPVGLWQMTSSENASVLVPSNLQDGTESSLVPPNGVSSAKLPQAKPTWDQPLWMLLAAAAVVLLAVEWCLFHRRFTV